MTTHKPRIVIVGGGAGGLELAAQLGNKLGKKGKAEIVLVDKSRSHIWKPLLHEVATGSLDCDLDGVVYSAHAMKHGYQFVLGEFCDLDAEAHTITLAPRYDIEGRLLSAEQKLGYDRLVLAVGAVTNDFGTPGVKEFCHFLDTHPQAQEFHLELLDNFTRLHQSDEKDSLHIAIVGAGATGVELSAELYHVAELLKGYGLGKMTSDKLKIALIEAGPRILPALPEKLAASARRELSLLGVDVMENTRINQATAEGFITSDGKEIKADMMLWAAGVKAPDYLKHIKGIELNRANQVIVDAQLRCKDQPDIYVLGDCCGFLQEDGSWVPPRAQAAHQMANLLGRNLPADLAGKPLTAYRYHDKGSLVNLSRYSTLGSLMGNLSKNSMFIEGKIARLMYISLYRMHQMAIHGLGRTVALFIAERLLKVVRPRMKLH
ncbi:NADH dehydrogenase [Shewanella sp. NFH-SH190041]|uniref:NAD(P)/FAD-dependent oxidoreductase n=1 Tax=Shewanella sp. NFH-SH190041 TaxID=2950245 RepID=UPI0021C2FB0A|nr:NAD(P)/FAD-dependent oxidoreductase [Shewanella sp. NFH-SH190041]BDM63423.1 NADH dehydrogenase [Shewanella sp. NFH-SH190041]